MPQSVVLGVDSSTQSTKVIAVDLDSGEVAGEGRAPHSGLDIQDPAEWWDALVAATRAAVSPDMHVAAMSVGGQQHGMVTLDANDGVVRPAPLWNNVDAAPDAERLNAMADFGREVGTRLVASITIAKLAHLPRTSPEDLARTEAVGLPHDWLNLRLTGNLVTDRGEASGSGWWSPRDGRERRDLLALGVGAAPGELVVSLGTSGTAFAVSVEPTIDETGDVEGFADATGRFLPLVCMLNCTRVVDSISAMVGLLREDALGRAEAVSPGADGL